MMPKGKSVLDLRDICLESVIINIDSYWCKDYLEKYKGQEKFMYVIGPFENFPGKFIQNLIDKLANRKLLRKHHFDVVLPSSQRSLDLTSCRPVANQDQVVRQIITQCQRLSILSLREFNKLGITTLISVANSLTALTHLDLSFTRSSDAVLRSIGRNCHELRQLKLRNCLITDAGLENISRAPPIDQCGCPKLEVLDVLDTSVGIKVIIRLIETLRNLKYLFYEQLDLALFDMYDEAANSLSPIPQFKLRSLMKFCHDDSLEDDLERMELVRKLCPNLTEFQRIDATVTDCHLLYLYGLPIRTLSVGNDGVGDQRLTFSSGILPFLQQSNLTVLNITNVVEIDIGATLQQCPELGELTISFFGLESDGHQTVYDENTSVMKDEQSLLSKDIRLKSLKLKKVEFYFEIRRSAISEYLLEQFLRACPYMEHLTLMNVCYFNDVVMDAVIHDKLLNNLQYLYLTKCEGVSGGSIIPFLHLDNNLNTLKLERCWNITNSDFKLMNSIVSKDALDIDITWC